MKPTMGRPLQLLQGAKRVSVSLVLRAELFVNIIMVFIPSNRDNVSCVIYIIDKNERTHMYSAHMLHRTLQWLELLRIFQNLVYLSGESFKLHQILLSQFLKYPVYFFNNF